MKKTTDDGSVALAEVALSNLRRGGRSRTRAIIESAQVCALVAAWAKTTRELGHEPTRREHAIYWKQTERGLYNELAKFRVAFPTEDGTPQNLANWLNAVHADAVTKSDLAAMNVPAPAWLAIAR